MRLPFHQLALTSALFCFALALTWLLAPGLLLSTWAVELSGPTALVCRRAAALFVGTGVMLFQLRHAPPSPARKAVATGLVASCVLLAALGVLEWLAGHAGPGILLAAAIETALATAFYLAR